MTTPHIYSNSSVEWFAATDPSDLERIVRAYLPEGGIEDEDEIREYLSDFSQDADGKAMSVTYEQAGELPSALPDGATFHGLRVAATNKAWAAWACAQGTHWEARLVASTNY